MSTLDELRNKANYPYGKKPNVLGRYLVTTIIYYAILVLVVRLCWNYLGPQLGLPKLQLLGILSLIILTNILFKRAK